MIDNELLQAMSNLLDQKLQPIKDEMQDMNQKVTDLEKDVNAVKRQIMKSTAELKAMDELILDEVERVHEILDKHIEDKTVHTA
ncbi:hypothetical protein D7V83_12740 [bacterium 0.1xD8-71]|nr:hypothetical protein D7V83_12740 [bacterium 0.1xD8-71]